jgi:predicted Zn-dependent protease
MCRVRGIFLGLAALAVIVGVAGTLLAAAGWYTWGDSRWYFAALRAGSSQPGPDYCLSAGEKALHHSDWDRADELVRCLDAAGYASHAHFLRGESFLRRRHLSEVVNELNQIPASDERLRVQAGMVFGLGFLSLQRPREAEELLLYVVQHQPENLDAHRGLATLYFDQGAKARAVPHVREWARLAPRDGHALWFLGLIESDFGDRNVAAMAAFREALTHDLNEQALDQVRLELAAVLLKETEYAQALDALTGLAPDQAESQKALEIQAECLLNLNRKSELGPLLDRGLEEYPNSLNMLRLHGQLLLDADHASEAVEVLQRAVRLFQQDLGCRHLLAQAYETLGRPAEAAEQRRLQQETRLRLEEMSKLSQAAMMQPWDTAVRVRLAKVCEQLDLHAEAAMWRKAAAACPPASAEATTVKANQRR